LYSAIGQYTVTLTATSGLEADRVTGAITVNTPVTAQFVGSPLTGSKPLTVTFTDQSTTTNGTINAWQWSFGDGATGTLQHPSHVYPGLGNYTVVLTASTGTYSDSETKVGYLSVVPPTTTLISYAYDGLYRLTSATSSSGESFKYQYDAVGNRTVYTQTIAAQVVTTYTYDAVNRLTSAGGVPHTWDANGNLLNDGSTTYAYDFANRLISTSAAGLIWSADYNGDGARLRQVVNGVPTTYTLDLAALLVQVLMQQDSNGTTRYLYGIMRVGEQQSAGWVYHLPDALGSVRQLADASAQVTLARGYMPYGETLWSVGTGSSAYGFTGENFDASVALVFLRARYMQPRFGVFLSRDPWEGDVSQPKTLNPYAYSLNNPVLLTDPSGEIPCPICWLLIALLAACDTQDDSCALEDLSRDVLMSISREEALARIQDQFNIQLPPSSFQFIDPGDLTPTPIDFRFVYDPSTSGDTAISTTGGRTPWFDQTDWGQVQIREAAFSKFDFNAHDIALIMVHEALHAWQQYSLVQKANDPNSDFVTFNARPNKPPYYTGEWYDKYAAGIELQAWEYGLDHFPKRHCLSNTLRIAEQNALTILRRATLLTILGFDTYEVPLVGYPLSE